MKHMPIKYIIKYDIIYNNIQITLLDGILVTLLPRCELYVHYDLPSINELYTFMEVVGHKMKICMVV